MPIAPQLHFPVTGSGKLGDMGGERLIEIKMIKESSEEFTTTALNDVRIPLFDFDTLLLRKWRELLGIGVVTAGFAHRRSGDSGLPGRIEASAYSASCTWPQQ